MSKLLLNEAPLAVLPSLATAIGLHKAIALQQLHWLLQNPKMGKVVDGKKWVYMSADEWQKGHFPFWGIATVKRVLTDLEEMGLISSRNDLNSLGIDRTNWYTINMDAVESMEKEFEANPRIAEYRRTVESREAGGSAHRIKASDHRINLIRSSYQNEPTIPEYSTETHTDTKSVSRAPHATPAAPGIQLVPDTEEDKAMGNAFELHVSADGSTSFDEVQEEGITSPEEKGASRSKGVSSAAPPGSGVRAKIAAAMKATPPSHAKDDNDLRGGTYLWAMATALSEVMKIDLKTNRGMLARNAKALVESGYKAGQIRQWYSPGGWYYKYSWLGKKGKVPNIANINQTVKQAAEGINPETGKQVVSPKPVVAETPQEKAKRELEKVRAFMEKERVRNIAPMDNLEKELKRMEDAYREKYETQSEEY